MLIFGSSLFIKKVFSGKRMSVFIEYLFIWDIKNDSLVDAYFFYTAGAPQSKLPADCPPEKGVERERKMEFIDAIGSKYRTKQYIVAGGYADSLDTCIKGFFCLEHDFDCV